MDLYSSCGQKQQMNANVAMPVGYVNRQLFVIS